MKEIGGYFELENNLGNEYFPNALAVNCGRNAAVLLCELRGYEKVYMPDFMCSSVKNALLNVGINVGYYSVGNDLKPDFGKVMSDNEVIYIVNYYGQLRDDIIEFKNKWHNIILDNAQDFFFKTDLVDCVYTCRKYFGVSDGGYATIMPPFDPNAYDALSTDVSFDRMKFVLGRYETNASDFYNESANNNHIFVIEPVRKMSKLTHNLLRAIDYERVKEIRKRNFEYLHCKLAAWNELTNIKCVDGAFMYPFRVKEGASLRSQLQQIKIYVPKLWPDVEHIGIADKLADGIVPLPCDQRYTVDDMEYIADQIFRILG